MQGNSTPYTNPALAIPGKIEIEHFDNGGEGIAYHDTSAGSHGQDYEQPPSYPVPSFRQPTDVDIYHSLDYSNSYLVVMQQGDWMKYSVDVAHSGTYTLEAQTFYWDSQGGTFHVEVDGLDKTGQIRIPGGTNVWQMVTKTGVQLTAGRHLLKVVCDSNGSDGYYMGDIDFLRFIASSQSSVAHWKFDEGSGTTAADSSGKGNTATVSGAAWTSGKVGAGALSFNGTSDYVAVASNASLTSIVNNFTLSFWANPSQSSTHEIDGEGTWGVSGVYNQRYLFGPYPYTDGTAGAGISVGSNGISVYEHAGNYMPATLVYQAPIRGWTHVTLVYENKQPRLYINGSLVRRGLTSPMAAVHINPLNLGGFSYGYYAGQLDDVRIYGSVLSGAEIQSLATQADGGQTTYRASTDFSTTQGYRNWYYISDTSDTLMSYRSDYNVWEGAEGAYQWLWTNGGHPMYWHDAIRQWRAPSAGNIQITGSASDANANCGDGVNVSITKNGLSLWQRNISNGDSTGYGYNLSLTVAAGDKINFIINKGSGNSVECDSTTFDPTITFTPTSASTYRASTDFSTSQGYRNWYYLDSNNNLMTFDAANNWWTGMEGGSSCCLILWATGGHPGAYLDAVRQWRAPQAGSVRISGTASVPGYGDGVVVTIRKGSDQLWQQTITGGNSTGVSFDLRTSVAQGERISFVINRNGTNMYDSTGLDPTITFTPSSSEPAIGYADFAVARLDAVNRTGTGGEDLLSGNYNWTLPLVSLPGRAGLDLGLALSYNSLVWTRSGSSITYDADDGFPSPGFRLGFPTIEPLFYNSQAGKYAYLLITPSGSRVELRQNDTNPSIYESADSSYLQLDASQMILRTTDGTRLTYASSGGAYHCTQIKDRNGNFITVNYDSYDHITTIIDTLGRRITFNYDGSHNLISITQARNGDPSHPLVTFGYLPQNLTIQTGFSGLTLTGDVQNGTTIPVLGNVCLDDDTCNDFNYTSWGQVWRIDHYVRDNVNPNNWILLNYVSYNLPANNSTPQSDCPRFTQKRVWAAGWNGDTDGVPASAEEAITAFSDFNFVSGLRQMTLPDGTSYKESFATTGWQRGLTTLSEVWSGGVKQKWTTVDWTQDTTGVSYQLNPRPIETNIYDAGNNRRRTTIDYGPAAYQAYGLPYLVTEYGGSGGATVLRRTYTDYQLGSAYTGNHIIGLVSQRQVFDGQALSSKIVYEYDAGGSQMVATSLPATQHDASYDTFAGARGNLTSISRYDATDPGNAGKALVTRIGYNTDGSPIFIRDPVGHQSTISYTDSFSDPVAHPATFAYPTLVTNADGYASHMQYDYYLGAVSRTVDPKGATAIKLYDAAGRIDRIYNTFNNAFQQFHYGPRYTVTFTSVKSLTEPVYAITWTDGLGQPYAMAQDAPVPGAGGPRYSGQVLAYDVMGRVQAQSNPTEMEPGWIPTGDDATGWRFTWQTYDWKGRPRVKTNVDGTTTEATYGGCGCAGGEVVETRDEVGRRQRAISDALGRVVKTELLNSDGATYSTAMTTYNALNQVTNVKQYQGSAESGIYQETVMTYDGYGRLASRWLPQQAAATLYSYYADDLPYTVTDARGATATYSYNGRHLVTGISYTAPLGVEATSPVSYSYDEAGNRTGMTDGLGAASYSYDRLSRLSAESRTFNGVGTFSLSYGYSLGGELTSLTDPFQSTVSYTLDQVGRTTAVTATGFGPTSQFASDLRYRAWGALKSLTYGSTLSLSLEYDRRLRPTSSRLSSGQAAAQTGMQFDYQYYADGSLRFAHDLADERFDRAYSYDEMGRVKDAFSGSEARDFIFQTQTPSASGPYRQTYSYNVWGEMTARQNRYWNKWDNFGASYVNGRNTDPLWEYNADGTVRKDKDLSYKYDAAGNNVEVRQVDDKVINSQVADADGQVIKRVEQNLHVSGSVTTTYYVRSSVLGGSVIAEVNSAAQKQKRNIYLGDEVLASEGVGGAITWKHNNPVTGSQGVSVAGGGYAPIAEYDPSGVNVGLEAPNAGPLFEAERPTLINTSTAGVNRCRNNSVEFDCVWLAMAFRNGAVGIEDPRIPADGKNPGRLLPMELDILGGGRVWVEDDGPRRGTARSEPDGDVVRVNHEEDGLGHWEYVMVSLGAQAPQNSDRLKFLTPRGSYDENQEKLVRKTLGDIADNEKCAKAFIAAGLTDPLTNMIKKGLVIGPATLLTNPDNVNYIGVTEAARRRDVEYVGSTSVQAITIRDHPGYLPDTTDGRARIFLNSSAFGGGRFSLREVLIHELIHVAGVDAKEPSWWGKTFRGEHDLSYYEHYESIMEACK